MLAVVVTYWTFVQRIRWGRTTWPAPSACQNRA